MAPCERGYWAWGQTARKPCQYGLIRTKWYVNQWSGGRERGRNDVRQRCSRWCPGGVWRRGILPRECPQVRKRREGVRSTGDCSHWNVMSMRKRLRCVTTGVLCNDRVTMHGDLADSRRGKWPYTHYDLHREVCP